MTNVSIGVIHDGALSHYIFLTQYYRSEWQVLVRLDRQVSTFLKLRTNEVQAWPCQNNFSSSTHNLFRHHFGGWISISGQYLEINWLFTKIHKEMQFIGDDVEEFIHRKRTVIRHRIHDVLLSKTIRILLPTVIQPVPLLANSHCSYQFSSYSNQQCVRIIERQLALRIGDT